MREKIELLDLSYTNSKTWYDKSISDYYTNKAGVKVEVRYNSNSENSSYMIHVNNLRGTFKSEKAMLKGLKTRLEKFEVKQEQQELKSVAITLNKDRLSEYDIQQTVKKLFEVYNINYSMEVKINNRLSKALGRFCFIKEKGKVVPVKLDFAKILTEIPSEHALQIVLHEVAHTIQYTTQGLKTQPHGKEFKKICKEIGCHQDKPQVDSEVWEAIRVAKGRKPMKPIIG